MSDNEAGPSNGLTVEQQERIRVNREKAKTLRNQAVKRKAGSMSSEPDAQERSKERRKRTRMSLFERDSHAGYFLAEEDGEDAAEAARHARIEKARAQREELEKQTGIVTGDMLRCEDCLTAFVESYLARYFGVSVCNPCKRKDTEERYSLITKGDAQKEYLLTDADLGGRDRSLTNQGASTGDIEVPLETMEDKLKFEEDERRRERAREAEEAKRDAEAVKALEQSEKEKKEQEEEQEEKEEEVDDKKKKKKKKKQQVKKKGMSEKEEREVLAEAKRREAQRNVERPPLPFVLKKNPHHATWNNMKLYLVCQVERRSFERFGGEDGLEEEIERRKQRRAGVHEKRLQSNIAKLRKRVNGSRLSSVGSGKGKGVHEHVYDEEVCNEADDTYTKTCTECGHSLTYEKM